MKKAKIILTAIAVFAIVGGALAFKTARFNEFQLWTINFFISSTTSLTTSTITTIGGVPHTFVYTYTATVPFCTRARFFATDDGDILITNARLTMPASVLGTLVGGTESTIIPFTACPIIPTTFVTMIP